LWSGLEFLYIVESDVSSRSRSLALPICVPAGFLYFLCTFGFALAAVEAWQADGQMNA
jgi:hypothetical protein